MEFIANLEQNIRWLEMDLAETDPLYAVTDAKARRNKLARIERRTKMVARLKGLSYNRVQRDRERSENALDKLIRMGENL
jgi:hypothetical protein